MNENLIVFGIVFLFLAIVGLVVLVNLDDNQPGKHTGANDPYELARREFAKPTPIEVRIVK